MRRSRSQPIRSAIISLLAVPLIALAALWALTASGALDEGIDLARARTLEGDLARPAQELVTALQHERELSLTVMGGPAGARPGELRTYREITDSARETFDRGIADKDLRGSVEAEVRDRMDRLGRDLGGLAALRSLVDGGGAKNRPQVYTGFRSLIDGAFAVRRAVSPSGAEAARDSSLVISLGLAREQISRADAIVAGRLPGEPTAWERGELARVTGARDLVYEDVLPQLPSADRDRYRAFFNTVDYQRLEQMEDRLLHGSAGSTGTADLTGSGSASGSDAVSRQEWSASADKVLDELGELEKGLVTAADERERAASLAALLKIVLICGLGLLALVLSLVIAWRVARRLIRESRALADTVGEFTRDQLPVLAELVRDGHEITDPGDPEGARFSVAEIERIFRSFTAARSAVLEAAQHEAATRGAVRDIFVNLSSRSQALLHRQLALLDQMERDAEDPDELARLFQLDHLATRMRRHAEGLVILAGKTPGRGWRSPVPLLDVVRGAASEVEDYTRVRVLPMPRVAVVGPAVADTIHLLADLLENAVQYSPPDTPIEVSGQSVAAGYVLEIEDRGLGLPPEVLDQLNERLAEPPDFTLTDSARLGLFVVARLARRHNIRVSLRASPYGGTTAVVFLPQTILSADLPTPESPKDRRATTRPAKGRALLEAAPAPRPAPASPVEDAVPVLSVAPTPPETSAASAPPAAAAVRGEEAPAEPELYRGLPRRRRKARADQEEASPLAAPVPAEPVAPATRPGAADPAASAVRPEPADPVVSGGAGPERSPDDLRLRMSAMQRGWERGRSESASLADEPSLPPEERP